jgi:hypothetical protein
MELLCTYRDVLALIPQLYNADSDKLSPLNEQEIYNFIFSAGQEVISQLSPWYGRNLKSTTRRVSLPTRAQNFEGTGFLSYSNGSSTIVVDPLAPTQCLKIEFTSATEFSVSSDMYGPKGSGNTSTAFNVSGLINIPAALWSGTFAIGNIFYISLYEYEAMLVKLTSLSAAVSILDSIYTEQMPNASENASRYQTSYNTLMKALKDQTAFLEVSVAPQDLTPIEIPYEIDQNGFDVTEYRE